MERANLILTFKFNDINSDAILNLYNEDFDFDYGIRKDNITQNNKMQVTLNILGDSNIELTQKFLFSNYNSFLVKDNLKEVIIEIFRPLDQVSKKFEFQANTFDNFSFIYNNNAQGDNHFILMFNFIPQEK